MRDARGRAARRGPGRGRAGVDTAGGGRQPHGRRGPRAPRRPWRRPPHQGRGGPPLRERRVPRLVPGVHALRHGRRRGHGRADGRRRLRGPHRLRRHAGSVRLPPGRGTPRAGLRHRGGGRPGHGGRHRPPPGTSGVQPRRRRAVPEHDPRDTAALGRHPVRGGRPVSHVLLVEDDDVIRETTQLTLERDGFRVTASADGRAALDAFHAERPDLALLDVMLPGLNGVSLCRRIREASLIPVIMVSARDDPVDIIVGLEAGADDYVTKPFDGAVLTARIRAQLRRAGQPTRPTGVRRFGDVEIDPDGVQVRRAGKIVALTPTEMKLMLRFAESPGTVLTRDVLLANVWEYEAGGDTRLVDVHVQRLRNKIGADRIETVRGFGYKLRNTE
ncbi:response regulator transcription factor [Actinomadura madurae]